MERTSQEGSLQLVSNRTSVSKSWLLDTLDQMLCIDSLNLLRQKIQTLPASVTAKPLADSPTGGIVWLKMSLFEKQILQICESKTLSRAQYYIERLKKSFLVEKRSKLNDINLNRWQEYEEILTDSLWQLDKREKGGQHTASYWGNFIPQIPRQLLLRYTKQGDWVIDPFLGSGTTLLESQALGRHGIGGELQPEVAEQTQERLRKADNPNAVDSLVVVGDSRTQDWRSHLQSATGDANAKAQLLVLHPPYHDIIRFSQHQECLSNCGGVVSFLEQFEQVCKNALDALDNERYVALVIGDKYSGSEWVPLGFQCMQVLQNLGCTLKSIVVKNFESTLAKRQTQELWRYRALVGGYYVFKHEYVFVLQKKVQSKKTQSEMGLSNSIGQTSAVDTQQLQDGDLLS
jgi:hypothetical protein